MLNRKKLVVDGIEPKITRSRANRENRSTSSTSPSYWIVVIYRYCCTKQVGCSWYAGLGEQATRCWSPLTDWCLSLHPASKTKPDGSNMSSDIRSKKLWRHEEVFFCRSEGSFNEWWMKLSSKLNPNVGISVLLAKKDSFMLEATKRTKCFCSKICWK